MTPMTTDLHPAHPHAGAIIEAIRATRLTLKLAVVDLQMVVSAHRDGQTEDAPLATAITPLHRHPGALAGAVIHTDYPEPQGLEIFHDLVEAHRLLRVAQIVGDTGIAAVVGTSQYLGVARLVCTSTFRGIHTVSVFRMRQHASTRLLEMDTNAGVVAELKVSAENVDSRFANTEIVWPYRDAGELIPDLSGDPVLGPVLKALCGANGG
jgi:hypothetical protein